MVITSTVLSEGEGDTVGSVVGLVVGLKVVVVGLRVVVVGLRVVVVGEVVTTLNTQVAPLFWEAHDVCVCVSVCV